MVYDITGENLRWAYMKLKNYIYYYHSSSYLKNKIIEFESNFIIDYPIDYFNRLANDLNKLAEDDFYMLSNEKISLLTYPKKNQVFSKEDNISIGDVNFFIDMDIKFYLVDILYSLSFFDLITNDNSFGNVFDHRMEESILENRLLLNNHNISYKNWKKNVFKQISNENSEGLSLIKIDMERCFYNIAFNINTFNEHYLETGSNKPVVKIMTNVYRLYNSKLSSNINGVITKANEVTLPIGLFSSFNICNLLLQGFDSYMSEQFIGYSRYVDDVLILSSNNDTANKILKRCFIEREDSNYEDKVFFFNSKYFGLANLKVNSKKTKTLRIRKNTSPTEVNKTLNTLLSGYNDETEDVNLSVDFDSSDSYTIIKRNIFKYINSFENERIIEYVDSLSDGELINIFPLWKKLYSYDKTIIDRVNKILETLILSNAGFYKVNKLQYITKNLVSTLTDELKYVQSDSQVFNLSQEDIINHVQLIYDGQEDSKHVFPINININLISFILSLNNVSAYFIDSLNEMHKKVNYFTYAANENISLEVNEVAEFIEVKITANDHLYHSDFYDSNSDRYSRVKIAVASLNIEKEDIKNRLMNGVFPDTYKMNDIFKIIKNASKSKCDVVIFPELAIPFDNAMDIINISRSFNISVICGLTHYTTQDGYLKNLTLISDNKLNISIVKEKNYFAPTEKDGNEDSYFEPTIPYYFIIDNSLYTYSTMTCFEATSIKDRAFLTDRIEMLFMPVLNRDTNYFSNIIGSFSRDASCFIAQSNVSIYGDSRITAPYPSLHMDLVKLKGGINNYYVVGEVDFNDLTKIYDNDDEKVKIVSAGNDRKNKRQNNKIR